MQLIGLLSSLKSRFICATTTNEWQVAILISCIIRSQSLISRYPVGDRYPIRICATATHLYSESKDVTQQHVLHHLIAPVRVLICKAQPFILEKAITDHHVIP